MASSLFFSVITCIVITMVLSLSDSAVAFVHTNANISPKIQQCKHSIISNPKVTTIIPIKAMKSVQLNASQATIPTYELPELGPIKAKLTKVGMITFVASMCVALPVTLSVPAILHKAKLLSRSRKEKASLRIGQFCSRWLMRVIPFANVNIVKEDGENDTKPAIWVCNHTSMLDIFFLLATDKKLRGSARPIKIIYWKDLEKNPVTGLLFKMCGFFPVEMEDNGNGNANEYKKSSFRTLLKGIKQAFEEGWDIGILPEGQLNPSPESGLQPVYPGAFTLARISKRPIRMMGLHGLHKLWHPDENIGMTVTGRNVKIRSYPFSCEFNSADDFVKSFQSIVGHFGAKGEDHENLEEIVNNFSRQKVVNGDSYGK